MVFHLNETNLGPSKISSGTPRASATEQRRPLPPIDKNDKERKFKDCLNKKKTDSTEEDSKTAVSPYALMREGKAGTCGEENFIASMMQVSQVKSVEGAPCEIFKPAHNTNELLRQLVESCAKALSEQVDPEKNTIRVELKLAIFDGATLEITQYKQAQREFSLAFHDLTNPEARALINNNEHSLRMLLLERGYTLQLVTIEPKVEVKTHVSSYAGTMQEKGRQQQEEHQEQPQK